MCWAVPAKVVEVRDDIAVVDFGSGMMKEVLVAIGERVEPGDVVLVHAGAVISKINEEELISTIELYRELAESLSLGVDFDVRKEVERVLEVLGEGDEQRN